MFELKVISVEEFVPNPWNSNRMSEEQFDHLKATIKKFGFKLPVVARPLNGKSQIIDGEHRWRAASSRRGLLADVELLRGKKSAPWKMWNVPRKKNGFQARGLD